MGIRTPERVLADRAPHDPKTDVKLAGDWLDCWLRELSEAELRAYLQLAHYYNTATYHPTAALREIVGGSSPADTLAKLERRGLVEVVRKGDEQHYHFPNRDSDGFHRSDPARPSLTEALKFQERMSQELTELTEQDETDDLREVYFERYPELLEEYQLYHSTHDASAPRWRLWMEVGNYLIRQFEQLYGSLRTDHGELFKEVTAKVLRHHLDVLDGVVGQLLEHLEELFPEVHDDWVIAPSEEKFTANAFVRRQAHRYHVGAGQLLGNVIEALSDHGRVVVSVDERGFLSGFELPSDTGLTKSEERVLFLTPAERARRDSPRNQERVRRARNKHANYLIERAVSMLADFVTCGQVHVVDAWLERIVALVNDCLQLLPQGAQEGLVLLEHVVERFDAVKRGNRIFPLPGPLPSAARGEDADEFPQAALPTRTTPSVKKKPAAKKKASKKKASKKKKPATKKTATKKQGPNSYAATRLLLDSLRDERATKKKTAKKKTAKKKASKKKTTKKKTSKKKPAAKKKASKKKPAAKKK
ncbi:MAG: hypothetical protein JKY65_13390, partial [Planctomycetes bacterium]|nr:hypothetical protein [Planctomycetota bacterium]